MKQWTPKSKKRADRLHQTTGGSTQTCPPQARQRAKAHQRKVHELKGETP